MDHAAAELAGLREGQQQVDDLGCQAKWNQLRKWKELGVGTMQKNVTIAMSTYKSVTLSHNTHTPHFVGHTDKQYSITL